MKKPCNECPFRRESWKGYLGDGSSPEEFMETIEYSPIPCHLKVDWESDDCQDVAKEVAWESPCVGSLQFMKNSLKMPRDRDYNRLVETVVKNPDVFQWKSEFINHHNGTL